jgi:hypothetical protein
VSHFPILWKELTHLSNRCALVEQRIHELQADTMSAMELPVLAVIFAGSQGAARPKATM